VAEGMESYRRSPAPSREPQSRESLSGEMAARSSAIGSRPRARWAFATRSRLSGSLFVEKNGQVVVFAAHGLLTLASRSAREACRQRDYRRDLRGERPSAAADKTPDSQGKQVEKRARESLARG